MPDKEKKLVLRKGVLKNKMRKSLYSLLRKLFDIEPGEFIPYELRYICFNELCVIYGKNLDIDTPTILYEDSWIGLYIKNIIVPSIPLTSKIFEKTGMKASIVVKDQGVKAFLYGNDILRESVIEIIPPDIGIYAVVDSSDNSIIGFARWSRVKGVYENIYDIGLFLRELG